MVTPYRYTTREQVQLTQSNNYDNSSIIRAGKRDLKGSIEHTFKTLNRFYHQNVEDTYKQQVIDLLIGEHVETLNFMEL